MCGIVGYLGPQDPKKIIIEGLKKLEYRGYDSAGIAVLNDGKTKRIRASGKLKNLEEKLSTENFNGHLGIGHTRWATHGAANERNAHPHQVGEISIVHNGIIENYLEIKKELIARGAQISSDTDSELVAHLINEEIQAQPNLLLAVQKTLSKLIGAFSVVVMWEKSPDEMIAFKDGPPLIVGLNEKNKEYFVVSDVQAALAYTKNFVYLDDREVVHISKKEIKYYSALGAPLKKQMTTLDWNTEQVEKMGFKHFMLKEIYEQPKTIFDCLRGRLDITLEDIIMGGVQSHIESLKNANRIIIIACGTSWHAGLVAEYIIEELCRIPVEVEYASEFRYRNPIVNKGDVIFAISQSGETADTLVAIERAKEQGAIIFGVLNVVGSSIARISHAGAYTHAGPEIGVASTKAFTAQLVVLTMIALKIAKEKKSISNERFVHLLNELNAVPSKVEKILSDISDIKKIASKTANASSFLYLGRGYNFPVALEGALKLKEISYIHAEGYPAAEMKHGPIALVDENLPVIFVATMDSYHEKVVSNIQEIKARKGKLIAVVTEGDQSILTLTEDIIQVPAADEIIAPILNVIPLQLLSYYIGISRGIDVDRPRNLAKSVTVE